MPLHTSSYVSMPLLAPAGSLQAQGTQRVSGALRTALPGRRLQAAAGSSYAQACAMASFAPLTKSVTAPPAGFSFFDSL